MPCSPPTNEEILRDLRYSREWYHRFSRDYFFHTSPPILNSTLPLPQVQLEHVQDSCNKSTAIYLVTPHYEPRTRGYNNDGADRSTIVYSIYQQWFRGHHVDIDFGNFVAKLISIKVPSPEQGATVEDVITIHQAWCEHVAATLALFSNNEKVTRAASEDYTYRHEHGPWGINEEQHMYYKLQPLFRALIIIIDNHAGEQGAGQIVHLVRTGLASELSALITFESIRPKLGRDMDFGGDNDNVVTTTLSAAIDFVMTLELREQIAFPERQRDLSVLDGRMGDTGNLTEVAKSKGYTGPEIRGPSTGWIKLAEGEDMLPPVTLTVTLQRHRAGLPPAQNPRSANRRKLVKKDSQIG